MAVNVVGAPQRMTFGLPMVTGGCVGTAPMSDGSTRRYRRLLVGSLVSTADRASVGGVGLGLCWGS